MRRKFNFLWIGEEYVYNNEGTPIKGTLTIATPGVCIITSEEYGKIMCHPLNIEPIGLPLEPLKELIKLHDHEE